MFFSESSLTLSFSGVWIGSWFQDRYGYKRTIQIALVGITGAIFVVFLRVHSSYRDAFKLTLQKCTKRPGLVGRTSEYQNHHL